MNSLWCVIADDFTGAGDSAIQFGERGKPVRLIFDPARVRSYARGAAALVVNTDTRFDAPEAAYERVLRMAGILKSNGIVNFYKKIDSTLRGNLASEIDAVMAAASYRFAVVAPSAPRNGRTVAGGVCLVNGKPVSSQDSARDPFTPVSDARVAALFASRFPGAVRELGLEAVRSGTAALRAAVEAALAGGARILIADAQTMEDLASVAGLSSMSGALFVGSSGLAEALAATRRVAPAALSLPALDLGRALFVIGSVTPTSAVQCRTLIQSGGAAEIVVDAAAACADRAAERKRLLSLARAVSGDRALLVRTSGLDTPGAASLADKDAGAAISRFLGELVPALLRLRGAEFLFASGGDTAARIAVALGAREIDFTAEILPGLPFGSFRLGPFRRRLYFVSKSGGFGQPTAMADALALVASRAETVKERAV